MKTPFKNPFKICTENSLKFNALNICYSALEEKKEKLIKYSRELEAMTVQSVQVKIYEMMQELK